MLTDVRQHPRYAVQIEAQIHLEGRTVVAVTKDMSRGGICIICPTQITPGSDLELSLSLSLGTDVFSEGLDLVGRVIWCTPMGQMYQVGAVFADLSPVKAGYLEMFLRFVQQEISLGTGEHALPDEQFDTGDADDS
jgi:hypothetical protein